MKGVVLAGGRGTRLQPMTHARPKQLLPVGNVPVLERGIEALVAAGITEIGLIHAGHKPAFQRHVGDGSALGASVTYLEQDAPDGIADAVRCARGFVGDDPFVVYLGDNLFQNGVERVVDRFDPGSYDAGVCLTPVERPERYGVVERDERGRVVRFVEKPDDSPSSLALTGLYMFTPAVFPVVERLTPSDRGELELTDALQQLGEAGAVQTVETEGWWLDVGTPADLLEANRLVLDDLTPRRDGTIAAGADVTGPVRIEAGASIRAGATVRGPAVVGADAVVGAGAVVGPDTSLGAGTHVESTTIEGSVCLPDCEVRTGMSLRDSVLGAGVTLVDGEDDAASVVVGRDASVEL